MTEQIQTKIIEAQLVDIFCFCCPEHKISQILQSFSVKNLDKQTRLDFLVYGLHWKNQSNLAHKLTLAFPKFFQTYSINIVPFDNKETALEHIKMIEQSANNLQFQKNYEQLAKTVQNDLHYELISSFGEQMGWSQRKIRKFIKQERIQNLHQLMNYQQYLPKQQAKITEIQKMCQKLTREFHLNEQK